MSLNHIAGVSHSRSLVAPRPIGVSAQFADARAKLRTVAPAGSMDCLFTEAKRLQAELGISPLEALHEIYRRLAAGWLPGNGVPALAGSARA